MAAAMDLETQAGRSLTVLSMRPLRNQSKTRYAELTALEKRLLDLLAPAGALRGIHLTSSRVGATEYTLGGTVYLIERGGREYWEIWFSLSPVDANWAIWRNERPVRLLRIRQGPRDRIEYSTR